MSVVDQRILVEAPVEAIWSYISDPALIPKWNLTCKQISVLSTKAMGLHSRRRSTTETGRSMVEEITAWLEHLGYEAVQIDGPYQSFKSRFRLQAIPEGTIVNWSVEYRLRGPMGGLRDATSMRRHQQDLMVESLRRLRKLLEASGIKFDPEAHARYAMQSPPSPESRIARMSAQSPDAAFRPIAVSEDDVPDMPEVVANNNPQPTAPDEALTDTGSLVPAYSTELQETISGAAVDKGDTKPRTPKGLRDSIAARRKDATERKDATQESAAVDASSAAHTVPISMVAPPRPPDPETETLEVVTPTPPPPNPLAPPDTLPERIPTGPMPAIQNQSPASEDAATGKRDTKEVSIWDVFGVERPSERAQSELEAVIASIQPKAEPVVEEEQITEAVPQLQMAAPKVVTPVRPLPKRRRNLKSSVQVRPARK